MRARTSKARCQAILARYVARFMCVESKIKGSQMMTWTLSDRVKGVVGASAPVLAAMLGIHIYEYLSEEMFAARPVGGFGLELFCIFYVVVTSLAGFALLLSLERKMGNADESELAPAMVLGLSLAFGLLMVLHRMAFDVVPL